MAMLAQGNRDEELKIGNHDHDIGVCIFKRRICPDPVYILIHPARSQGVRGTTTDHTNVRHQKHDWYGP